MLSRILGLLKKNTAVSPIILVSGLPRSGTSLMMKMLQEGGVHPVIDRIRSADGDNPQGYYEFEKVKQLPKGEYKWLEEAKGKAVKIVSTLLVYLPQRYNYKIIFMRRHTDEIIASQKKMMKHRGSGEAYENEAETKNMLEGHLVDIMKWIDKQKKIDCLHIHFNELLKEPDAQLQRMSLFLDVDLDTEKMKKVINPDLYRNRSE